VRNRLNEIAVVRLGREYRTGTVTGTLTDPDFRVPTTVDAVGSFLYAVNARFGIPDPGTAEYQVVQLSKPKGR
jgi:hypothetical protein